MTKLLLNIVCILILRFSVVAQNYRADIESVFNTLRSLDQYSLSIEYNIYLDGNKNMPYQSRTVEMKMSGDNVLMKQNKGIEVLYDKTCDITVDHTKKRMSASLKKAKLTEKVNPTDREETTRKKLFNEVDLFSKEARTTNFVINEKGYHVYEFGMNNTNEAKKITVTLDAKRKIFQGVVLEYREPIRIVKGDSVKHQVTVEVKYTGFSIKPVFTPGELSCNRFINRTADQITAAGKFRSYEFTLSK